MRIYLDVSCLNRPFDDQTQLRIRLEAEAVHTILRAISDGKIEAVGSEMVHIEIDAISDDERRNKVPQSMPASVDAHALTTEIVDRGRRLVKMGLARQMLCTLQLQKRHTPMFC